MVKVFISYSHKNEVWKDRLEVHLQGLVQQEDIELTVWDDRHIEGGEDWYPAIMKELGEASVAICLISADFLASKFIIKEEIPVMVERREKDGMLLLPVLVEPCVWEHIQWLKGIQMLPRDGKSLAEIHRKVKQKKSLSEITGYVYERVKDPKFRVAAAVPEWEEPERIDIERLPETGMELFGRQEELEMLEKAWDSDETRVVSLVAWGGVGKSTLVNRWLELMGRENYRGARKVFGWSFYSQGTKERVTSADRFIAEGLKWFGDPDPAQGSMWEKGRRLVDLIRKDRTLLILDGLEPLQWGATMERGKIKDPILSLVVTELAKENGGLCVITTREEVAELRRFAKGVEQRNLEQISKEAGGALLRVGGVKGTDAEREAASEDFGNYALAVNLLATYLHDIEGHNVKNAGGIGDIDIPEEEGRHPRRVIEAFEERFGEGPQVQVLRILGLFDRPAEMGAIEAVRGGEAIEGLTDELAGLTEGQLRDVLDELRGYKLIAKKSEHNPNIVDCHPLVREHFGEKLRLGNPDGWREAHGRLYEYYRGACEKELPDTLAEMEPLFAAVRHGCQAGRYQEACDEVYFGRIMRGNEYYIVSKLGTIGAWLAVLSGFFEEAWSRPVSELEESNQTLVLNGAGAALRALGWLRESAESMRSAVSKAIKEEDWNEAARDAGNLCDVYLTLGKVKAAVDYGRRSVEYADKSGDEFIRVVERTTLAVDLHQAGVVGEARELFEEAEGIQKEWQAEYPLLYSVRGFRFCDLILSEGGYEEVEERATETIKIAEENKWLIDMALDKLSLGCACLLEASRFQIQNFRLRSLRRRGIIWAKRSMGCGRLDSSS